MPTARGATLVEVDLVDEYGYDIPTGSRAARRAPCSACGMTKRHLFDQAAIDGGYDVLVTGHNLDDEAAVLFGNVLHWHTEYLGRQAPVLPARDGFPKKVKPLVRLGEREMAAYCIVQRDRLHRRRVPDGGRQQAPRRTRRPSTRSRCRSPGAKADFYLGFLARAADRFSAESDEARELFGTCERCGAPSTGEVCAFCRLVERAGGRQPVSLRLGGPGD